MAQNLPCNVIPLSPQEQSDSTNEKWVTIPSSIDQGEWQSSPHLKHTEQSLKRTEEQYGDLYLYKAITDFKAALNTAEKSANKPTVITDKLHSLPSESYEIVNPIKVLLKLYEDEVVAIIPELELFADGENEVEAINELKLELLDLIEDLEETPNDKLGVLPLSWKKALKHMIRKCQ